MRKFLLFLITTFLTVFTMSCGVNNQEQVIEENDTIEEIIEEEEDGDTIVVIDLKLDQDTTE